MASSEPPVDIRPADLVSRLLAATPPYLYTMPLTNSFFFSEMLRSFVQARASPGGGRRGRKRAWREARPPPPPAQGHSDKPLELTTNTKPPPSPPPKADSPKEPSQNLLLPPCNLLPPLTTESILPPTAPLWYPHMNMYPPPPPQCFDPHFFVDLRVSGHIWDRKVEKDTVPTEPLNLQTDDKKGVLNLSFRKHNSAFSVPQPREHHETASAKSPCGANYVLQNLDKIYKDVKTKQEDEEEKETDKRKDKDKDEEELTPEEKRVRDLRALIGLELVVDYVKQESGPGDKGEGEELSDSSDSNQEPLVMD